MPLYYTLYFFFCGAFYPNEIAHIIDDCGGKGDAQHQQEHIDKPAAGGINVLKDCQGTLHIGGDVETVDLISVNKIEALGNCAGNIIDNDALYVAAAFCTDAFVQIKIQTDENKGHMPEIGVDSQGDNGMVNTAGLYKSHNAAKHIDREHKLVKPAIDLLISAQGAEHTQVHRNRAKLEGENAPKAPAIGFLVNVEKDLIQLKQQQNSADGGQNDPVLLFVCVS